MDAERLGRREVSISISKSVLSTGSQSSARGRTYGGIRTPGAAALPPKKQQQQHIWANNTRGRSSKNTVRPPAARTALVAGPSGLVLTRIASKKKSRPTTAGPEGRSRIYAAHSGASGNFGSVVRRPMSAPANRPAATPTRAVTDALEPGTPPAWNSRAPDRPSPFQTAWGREDVGPPAEDEEEQTEKRPMRHRDLMVIKNQCDELEVEIAGLVETHTMLKQAKSELYNAGNSVHDKLDAANKRLNQLLDDIEFTTKELEKTKQEQIDETAVMHDLEAKIKALQKMWDDSGHNLLLVHMETKKIPKSAASRYCHNGKFLYSEVYMAHVWSCCMHPNEKTPGCTRM